ncbi:hypothetical protein ONE63_000607 [Megalurothrips usitatus]|uniref:Uncharacterized protein n=1 Tax=Megalurothrips usitatus TaxID=439358 RepID=A0AAV7XYZ8_9NEOP|nr:hypothetical protein ONE63_000607 [Megalurothrips usitatus]
MAILWRASTAPASFFFILFWPPSPLPLPPLCYNNVVVSVLQVALRLSARNALSVKLALAPTLGEEKNHYLKNGDVDAAAPAANNNNSHNNNNNQQNRNNHNHIRHSAASPARPSAAAVLVRVAAAGRQHRRGHRRLPAPAAGPAPRRCSGSSARGRQGARSPPGAAESLVGCRLPAAGGGASVAAPAAPGGCRPRALPAPTCGAPLRALAIARPGYAR